MLTVYLFLLVVLLGIVVIAINFWVYRKNNISGKLFAEALRDENSGDLKKAVITYQKALQEVKQTRFQSELKIKITDKIKLLRSAIEYEKNVQFTKLPSQSVKLN